MFLLLQILPRPRTCRQQPIFSPSQCSGCGKGQAKTVVVESHEVSTCSKRSEAPGRDKHLGAAVSTGVAVARCAGDFLDKAAGLAASGLASSGDDLTWPFFVEVVLASFAAIRYMVGQSLYAFMCIDLCLCLWELFCPGRINRLGLDLQALLSMLQLQAAGVGLLATGPLLHTNYNSSVDDPPSFISGIKG